VIDLYSLTESGPVAAANDGVYRTARHDLYVEIVGPDGRPCAPGERGEIVLTGGQNPFFPLLRYRTGDHAAMEWIGGHPALVRLEGRRATVFRDGSGGLLNGVDIAAALRPLHLGRYRLHQHADRRVVLQLEARDLDLEAGAALGQLFGPAISIEYGDLADGAPPDGHVARSTSEIPLTAAL
jgi:phenylacetate-CoA ligase